MEISKQLLGTTLLLLGLQVSTAQIASAAETFGSPGMDGRSAPDGRNGDNGQSIKISPMELLNPTI